MATNAETIVVVTDANVLINLLRIGQLPLLGNLDAYRFLVPEEVVAEVTDPDQREALSSALAAGYLGQAIVDTMESLQLFAELRDMMGRGEAACLALAATMGCHIASDEKKRFRRRAVELIGEERIVRTEGILLEAIRQGRISVAEADGFKEALAANRYSMPFQSFSDLL
jgi:predicted nucleic acid-binding protein